MSGLVLHLPRQMYAQHTLTYHFNIPNLRMIEPTYSSPFAILEFVADNVIGIPLGDGDCVLVSTTILPSVDQLVAWHAVDCI